MVISYDQGSVLAVGKNESVNTGSAMSNLSTIMATSLRSLTVCVALQDPTSNPIKLARDTSMASGLNTPFMHADPT